MTTISIVTIFPQFFDSPLSVGIIGRAVTAEQVNIDLVNPRSWGKGATRRVDDAPFGGGPGMIMTIEPIASALDGLEGSHKVLLAAGGSRLRQADLERWSQLEHLTLVCGRYEGVDQRVADHLVDEEISLGDYVLAGGETAALAIVEGVVRLLPGVVGNPQSITSESFSDPELVEEPQYSRPAEFRGWQVPPVLLSGNHRLIEEWRQKQRIIRTRSR